MFKGGSQLPSNSARVLVSTPEAYLALAKRSNSAFDLHTFSLVIFDEVHHVSKDHPYSRVAKKLADMAGSGQGHPIQASMDMCQILLTKPVLFLFLQVWLYVEFFQTPHPITTRSHNAANS